MDAGTGSIFSTSVWGHVVNVALLLTLMAAVGVVALMLAKTVSKFSHRGRSSH